MAEANTSESLRLRLAETSYREVLDATKHQDDKIGRFLTAIAFLFTGAVAFGTRGDLLAVRIQFLSGSSAVPAPLVFLGLFFVASILSVLLLMIAVGPNLKLPRRERPSGRPSPFFFLSIARRTESEWKEQWVAPRPTEAEVVGAYLGETHNLAIKTDFKYSRTNEARSIFTLGLLFLVLALVLWVSALSGVSAPNESSEHFLILEWSGRIRLAVAGVVSLFAVALSYDYLRLEQELDYYVKRREAATQILPLYGPMLLVPSLVFLLVLPMAEDARLAAGAASFVLAILLGLSMIPFVVFGENSDSIAGDERLTWASLFAVAGLILGLICNAALLDWTPYSRLWLAIVLVLLVETPRAFVAWRLWRSRRRRVRALRNWGRPNGSISLLLSPLRPRHSKSSAKDSSE